MFDIITFGSATKDIFLSTEEGGIFDNEEFVGGRGICFPLGSKVRADEIYFTSGGGGTNTAVSLSKQGFEVAYCGKVGEDSAGDQVMKDLKRYGIKRDLVSRTEEELTNHSVVVDIPEKDRTIFVYRGASDLHSEEDVNFEKLRAEWFYLAPFSDFSMDFFYSILEHAQEEDINLMVNPSKSQLKEKRIWEALGKVDVLLLNMEEAAILTGRAYDDASDILKELKGVPQRVLLVTQGTKGVYASDGEKFYYAKPVDTGAVDRTGAGDSFGSGFLSRFIRTGDIKEGVALGIANSTACLKEKGAKNGLLKEGDEHEEIPVEEGDLEEVL